ncbi:SE1561 family protein [Macrococcus carouselicus]|uniref:SE1561 family protein n=1 Tax=Macrococcus carouselicus TaxID=69969 RepID=UPI00140B5DB6|nr:SE1561 family protein [Macrococcus carouselicus]
MANESLNEIKEKLSDFIEKIDAVDPETTDMADIDEWLAILDQLEAKVKSIK